MDSDTPQAKCVCIICNKETYNGTLKKDSFDNYNLYCLDCINNINTNNNSTVENPPNNINCCLIQLDD